MRLNSRARLKDGSRPQEPAGKDIRTVAGRRKPDTKGGAAGLEVGPVTGRPDNGSSMRKLHHKAGMTQLEARGWHDTTGGHGWQRKQRAGRESTTAVAVPSSARSNAASHDEVLSLQCSSAPGEEDVALRLDR
ncbi:hypothetical protein MHYP_G00117840 [Metynnis hypsauchen]